MQEPQHLIRILHITNPRIPCTVFYTIAEARKHENDWKNRVWRVHANYYVGYDFAGRADGGYAELPEAHVYRVVEQCGEGVAYEWG
jgi:hypothetical protein